MGSWVFQPQSGPVGPPGPPGADGAPGADSTVPGPDGADGKSAYEIAVENGFVGTEQEWLDSLVGPEGPDGPGGTVAATPYEQIEVVGPTLELADATFGHLLPNTAHFDQIEMFPVGMIISWVGDYGQVPNGWLLCHGQNLTGYESDLLRLYQIMPDYHGVGFFHTPDLRGRSPVGHLPEDLYPIDNGYVDGSVIKNTLGQRHGDWRMQAHWHWMGPVGDAFATFDGMAESGQDRWNTKKTEFEHPGSPQDNGTPYKDQSGPRGGSENQAPATVVNFLIYAGQDTAAIKDRDDLGNVPTVTTRMMIEARLAEAGIGEEEVKMLKEHLETLKTAEAK